MMLIKYNQMNFLIKKSKKAKAKLTKRYQNNRGFDKVSDFIDTESLFELIKLLINFF